MKKAIALVLSLSIVVAASAQQQRPPVVGGIGATGDGTDMKDARRAVMRETLQRQYTAEEIDEYRRAIDAYERSKAGLYSEAAKAVRRRVTVGLGPEAPIHELRLNAETVGAMVFTDSVGNPWTVDDVVAPGYVTVAKHGNMVIFKPAGAGATGQAPQRFGRGSVTILLEGLSSTVPFQLSYGLSREVDGQIEAQVQARNPRAIVNAVQSGAMETDEVFGMFLDGEPPGDARRVKTTLKSVDAWTYRGLLYVRTALAVHSPAFRMYGSSASGMSVYKFDRMPTIVNAIQDGQVVSVGIGEE